MEQCPYFAAVGGMRLKSRKGSVDIRTVIIIILSAVIVFCIAILAALEVKKHRIPENPSGGGIELVIDEDAGDYTKKPEKDVGETSRKGGIAIPGWSTITLPADTVNVGYAVDFHNPEANAGKYYLSFELRLLSDDGSYEILYSSKLVEPGKHIQKITLSRPLSEGTYSAVVHVQPYTMTDDPTPTNNADIKVKLIAAKEK